VPAKGDRLEEEVVDEPFFEASLFDLLSALSKVLQRVPKDVVHEIIKDEFTVEEKMADVQKRIAENKEIRFSTLFEAAKDKMEIITIFMALLELIRLRAVVAIQKVSFGEIMIAAEDAKVGPTPVGPDPAVEAQ
jgi:segregation and condensation protein A